MFVILSILIGIIIGLLRKGQMGGIFSQKISLWFLGVVGLVVQFGLHLLFYAGISGSYLAIINFISYILILVTLVFNLNHIWAILVTVGFTANFLVIFINGGALPVSSNVISGTAPALATSISNEVNAVYMMMDTAATRLWCLGDVLRIPGVGGITGLYGAVPSIAVGTFLIFIGLAGWIQRSMVCASKQMTHVFEDDEFGTSDDIIPKENPAPTPIFQEESDSLQELSNDHFEFSELPVNDLYAQDDFGLDDFNQNDLNFENEEKYLQEEALTDLTEYIPRLTPEMIAEIRRNSLEESNYLLNNDSYDTRVFSSFGEMNEQKEDNMCNLFEDEFSSSKRNKGYDDDFESDLNQPDSRWSDWDPKTSGYESVDEPQSQQNSNSSAGQVVNFDDMDKGEEQKKMEWNPQDVERNAYASGSTNTRNQRSNPYSTLYNRTESPVQKGRSSEEMMDIWHRAYEEDTRKRRVHYKPEETNRFAGSKMKTVKSENELSESPQSQAKAQTESPRTYEQAREDMAKKWDAKSSAAKLINLVPNDATERVDSKENLRQSLTEKDEQKTAEKVSNLEREKAGYEKVELEIEGRVVSFWRKKKV